MEENARSAYEEIGGNTAVKAAVTVFYNRVLVDSELAGWFDGIDLSRLKAHQRAFLTMALAGPDVFAGRGLHEAHAGMSITHEAFDAILAHLATALADVGVDYAVIDTLIERLETQRSQIVTTPTGASGPRPQVCGWTGTAGLRSPGS